MSIQEQRRAAFEAWAERHNSELCEDGIEQPEDIRLDRQAGVYIWANAESAWLAWNAAMDSLVIELPNQLHAKPYACYEGGWNDALLETADLIEGMGLKVAP